MPAQAWGPVSWPSPLAALPKLHGQPTDGQHLEASEMSSTVVQGMVQYQGGRVWIGRTPLFSEVIAPRGWAKYHGRWSSCTVQQLPLYSPKFRGSWHAGSRHDDLLWASPDRCPAGWVAQALLSRPRLAQSVRLGRLTTFMTQRRLPCSGPFLPCTKNTVNSGKAIQVRPTTWNLRGPRKPLGTPLLLHSPPPNHILWGTMPPTPANVPEHLVPASASICHKPQEPTNTRLPLSPRSWTGRLGWDSCSQMRHAHCHMADIGSTGGMDTEDPSIPQGAR